MVSFRVDPGEASRALLTRPRVNVRVGSDGEAAIRYHFRHFPQQCCFVRVLAEAEKTHRGAMAGHGIFFMGLSLFTETRCCRAAALSTSIKRA